MTSVPNNAVERNTLIDEIVDAVLANSHCTEEEFAYPWKPEWSMFEGNDLQKLHSLVITNRMSMAAISSMREIMNRLDYTSYSNPAIFIDDLSVHLRALSEELTGLRFWDEEVLPAMIHNISKLRQWLPMEEALSREDEMAFMMVERFFPSYTVQKHYPEIVSFIRRRSIDDARSALRLLDASKVKRLAEAEHIIDNEAMPLANGAL
jgi:hypothetical protein